MNDNTKDGKKLGVGMIGAGSSAKNIAETISVLDTLEFKGICNHDEAKAKIIAEKHDVPFTTSDYKELCNKDDIDFIVVSLPHGLHHEVVMHALKKNKHVLVEKPIATTIQDAREMINLAREKNLKLGVHFQCRFFDAVQEARKLLLAGKIGKVLQANVSVMWYRDQDYYKKSNWRGTWKLEGGGSLINQAIHTIDEMIYLVGDVKKLFGFWKHAIHDIEVDDLTAAAFVFENGVLGTLQTSTATKAAFPAKLTIFGSEGGLEISGNILTIHDASGNKETIDYAAKEGGQVGSEKDPKKFSLKAHSRLMNDFVEAIINDREPLVNGEEGLKSLKVVRAVYDSNGENIINL
ncbi:MAG: Gfo/Idh/MocA family protein [Promethearchaeota archaeon]